MKREVKKYFNNKKNTFRGRKSLDLIFVLTYVNNAIKN